MMAIRVSRIDAFFAIAAMFFAARALADRHIETTISPLPQRRSNALAGAFAVAVAALAFLIVPRVLNVPMEPASMPDAQVVRYVKDQQLKGNVLTWFDWGDTRSGTSVPGSRCRSTAGAKLSTAPDSSMRT